MGGGVGGRSSRLGPDLGEVDASTLRRLTAVAALLELETVDEATDVRAAYDDEWVELVAFREAAIHWIIRDGEDVDDG